ncbi:hypothetical protein VCCP103710_0149, partial [Vibrio cholerae CP1037(10)]
MGWVRRACNSVLAATRL